MGELTVTGIAGIPEVKADDDLADLILRACAATGFALEDGDVLVVSSKVVSKSLGLWADEGDRTAAVAGQTVRVVAERRAGERITRIVQSTSGPVMAAAGVDASNTGGVDGLLLLPTDPDAEAARLREDLVARTGLASLGVVLSDTAGRPWRVGQTDFALGAAGVAVTDDLRGGVDGDGQPLQVTTRAVADELAAAADLVKGKVDHVPVAVVRGSGWALAGAGHGARALVRTGREDWFALGRAEAIRSALGIAPGTEAADRVGLPSVTREPADARVERALLVACAELPVGSRADTSHPGVVELSADTAYAVGVLAARAQVALWGEGFDTTLPAEPARGEAGDWRVRLELIER